MEKNLLVRFLDGLRNIFETASPSVFSMLATLLPYLSPLPIAILTAASATAYLGMKPITAGVFVFVLEGLGLWVTTVFVDTIVQYIRSKNPKTLFMVFALLIVLIIYVTILINLNVYLKMAVENVSATYIRIITLMCFLPLISGFMNGYWKLQLEHKTETEIAQQRDMELQERIRQDKRHDGMEKYRIKHGYGTSKSNYGTSETTSETTYGSSKSNGSSKTGRPSIHQERVFSYLDEQYRLSGVVPTFSEVANNLDLPQSTASRLRNEWINTKQ